MLVIFPDILLSATTGLEKPGTLKQGGPELVLGGGICNKIGACFHYVTFE
jgi:hypothetical protein